MSLADELLADLEEAGDEGEDGLYPEEDEGDSDGEESRGRADGGLEDIPEEMEVDYSKTESVRSIAKLRNSKQVSTPVRVQIFRVRLHFWLSLYDLVIRLFLFYLSFQRLWTKYLVISESNARIPRVSLTSIFSPFFSPKTFSEFLYSVFVFF